MFTHNFAFGIPQSPSSGSTTTEDTTTTSRTSREGSPCSPTTPLPPATFSVADLSAVFANSRLRQDAQICYDSCDAYAATDDDAGWQLDPLAVDDSTCDTSMMRRVRSLPPRPYSPTRRTHRQSQTRLLCSRTHHKEIATLVSRMVECEEQCSIITVDQHSQDEMIEDEGYDSSEATTPSESRRSSVIALGMRLQYRRSTDFKTSNACVNKAVRFRKERRHRRIRSSESES